ncbi:MULTISPECIES: sulfurtransferase complex subunit TusB [Pseudomonas syringae group]|uniref:Sulfurtransferase complex subunit TusB n=4 Tax=Pseudomonas syringae group TaxID=136849 RepID=A0AAD0DPU9_9PSED|nr:MULTISPECIES: sulfurtransferase complex subunit TusB [Pseudomonas syringae group]AVB19932.1 sulfurtransferase complex subunit TusB [Pseudomonas avellanae]EGH09952.1 DsrH family protein [Pseudomonas amygdali pv. morsprunorum str. M302280]KWS62190.1 sulfur relay protein DsrH [Pseudomonas amygdali pv. morsprunorum]PHN49587.1 sulfur relay protein DsrH [Pseudomonas avellanae]POC92714.1 sulfur relay protein DsrH [Pseudomonas avellanae]
MATLHVVSHSPFADARLDSCLRLLGTHDGLLLCGDAAYALMPASAHRQNLQPLIDSVKLFVLDEDLKARDLPLPAGVNSLDYPAFVDLSLRFDKVNTWL